MKEKPPEGGQEAQAEQMLAQIKQHLEQQKQGVMKAIEQIKGVPDGERVKAAQALLQQLESVKGQLIENGVPAELAEQAYNEVFGPLIEQIQGMMEG